MLLLPYHILHLYFLLYLRFVLDLNTIFLVARPNYQDLYIYLNFQFYELKQKPHLLHIPLLPILYFLHMRLHYLLLFLLYFLYRSYYMINMLLLPTHYFLLNDYPVYLNCMDCHQLMCYLFVCIVRMCHLFLYN